MSVALNIIIPNSSSQPYAINWPQTANAQTLLEFAFDQNTYPGSGTPFNFGLEFYGTPPSDGGGYLVNMINGISETSSSPYEYWQFLVNGQPSNTGIDETMINDGDVVEFEYTAYNPARHGTTGPNALKAKFRTT